jgi:uncharacterized protein YegL
MNLYRPLDQAHSPAVDWYAVGVIAFGLAYGREYDPFASRQRTRSPRLPPTGLTILDDAIRQLTDPDVGHRTAAATLGTGVVARLLSMPVATSRAVR